MEWTSTMLKQQEHYWSSMFKHTVLLSLDILVDKGIEIEVKHADDGVGKMHKLTAGLIAAMR